MKFDTREILLFLFSFVPMKVKYLGYRQIPFSLLKFDIWFKKLYQISSFFTHMSNNQFHMDRPTNDLTFYIVKKVI